MSKIKVKTSKEPASVSRAAVKAAVEAVYGRVEENKNNKVAEPEPSAVLVRVTKKVSEKGTKAKK